MRAKFKGDALRMTQPFSQTIPCKLTIAVAVIAMVAGMAVACDEPRNFNAPPSAQATAIRSQPGLPRLVMKHFRQRVQGDLRNARPDVIYHEFAVVGLNLAEVDNLSTHVRVTPPLSSSVGHGNNGMSLLVSFPADTPSTMFQLTLAAPDGRQASVTFRHQRP
jgi:hypothetical protein